MTYESGAIPVRSLDRTLADTPREAALVFYKSLLRTAEYYPIEKASSHHPLGHIVFQNVRDESENYLRKARVIAFSAELAQELVLDAIENRNTFKSNKPIWPANRDEPFLRTDWEQTWPGVIPKRCAPPFESTLVVFSHPLNALMSLAGSGSRQDETALVALLLHGEEAIGYVIFEKEIHLVPLFDAGKVFYTMPSLITYIVLDALMNPEVQMTEHALSRRQRKGLQRAGAKVTMRAPAPYYEVKMTTNLRPTEPGEGREVEWSHRWDVRAHHRTLIRRGKLPLRPKDRSKLTMRGYTVFETDIALEGARALSLRGKPPKRDDEWVAIKTSLVKSHRRGPEDKPYVPSVHTEEWSDRL